MKTNTDNRIWECRRYEIARDALTAMIPATRAIINAFAERSQKQETINAVARQYQNAALESALWYADELIKRLKNS